MCRHQPADSYSKFCDRANVTITDSKALQGKYLPFTLASHIYIYIYIYILTLKDTDKFPSAKKARCTSIGT